MRADGRLDGAGEIPPDFDTFGAMVQDISYRNAKAYFAIPGVAD
jgi:glucuronate isomerase